MSGRIQAIEIEPGMKLNMQGSAWIVETVETVASSTGPLIRLVTRGLFTGSRRPMTMGPRHTVKIGSAPRVAVTA